MCDFTITDRIGWLHSHLILFPYKARILSEICHYIRPQEVSELQVGISFYISDQFSRYDGKYFKLGRTLDPDEGICRNGWIYHIVLKFRRFVRELSGYTETSRGPSYIQIIHDCVLRPTCTGRSSEKHDEIHSPKHYVRLVPKFVFLHNNNVLSCFWFPKFPINTEKSRKGTKGRNSS